MFGGNHVLQPKVRAQLAKGVGMDPSIGFVLLGPDLNLYLYDVEFRDERLHAEIPWAKLEMPLRMLWGSGRVRTVRLRELRATIVADADISRSSSTDGDEAAGETIERPPPPQLVIEDIDIQLRQRDGSELPLLKADYLYAQPAGARKVDVEVGAGTAGEIAFDGITTRVQPSHGHLLVKDFKMRTFGGLVDGFLDLHLKYAGRYNGELHWHLLEVERICRYFELDHAERRRGKLAGNLKFKAWGPQLDQFEGAGEVRMERARFWSPVSFKVFGVLGLPQREESWLVAADVGFSVEDGLLYLERGALKGTGYVLDIQGIIDLDGACDLEAEFEGTTVAVTGRLADPSVRVLPFNAVTAPIDRMKRKPLRKR